MSESSHLSASVEALASTIDHTALKPETNEAAIRKLCEEARQFGFASVCVNPTWVPLCAELLVNSPVKVCTVIGFPLGATLTSVKAFETTEAIAAGATEVDMVINIGWLKDGRDGDVRHDIAAVVSAARAADPDVLVKVIIETALLSEDEKRRASKLTQDAGADFVKTSTGFSSGGATVEDVALMRSVVGESMGVKAAGGIRTAADAQAMIAAGATRLGASAGVQIMRESQGGENANNAGGAY
ncbi:deoxyribose-phosphate aldolase [bacterium]|nr:deoxyribose-phosphate aldolase [bacterium]